MYAGIEAQRLVTHITCTLLLLIRENLDKKPSHVGSVNGPQFFSKSTDISMPRQSNK